MSTPFALAAACAIALGATPVSEGPPHDGALPASPPPSIPLMRPCAVRQCADSDAIAVRACAPPEASLASDAQDRSVRDALVPHRAPRTSAFYLARSTDLVLGPGAVAAEFTAPAALVVVNPVPLLASPARGGRVASVVRPGVGVGVAAGLLAAALGGAVAAQIARAR